MTPRIPAPHRERNSTVRRTAIVLALCAIPLATDVRAQRLLLEVDGVALFGEAQLVWPGAGTCNVLETDTSYETRKENDGAPMDIWRLDFTVRNGSGRWLDHLVATYGIASEMPECTNWDVADSVVVQYPFIPVEWGGSLGSIQESGRNVVSPGQTLIETKLMLVLRGDPAPRFSDWYVNFDFAANPPPAGAAASGADPPPAVGQPVAATAEQESLFWQSIEDSTNPAEFESYLTQFPNGVFRALAEARLAALRERPDETGTAAELRRTSPPSFTGIEEPSEEIGFCGLPLDEAVIIVEQPTYYWSSTRVRWNAHGPQDEVYMAAHSIEDLRRYHRGAASITPQDEVHCEFEYRSDSSFGTAHTVVQLYTLGRRIRSGEYQVQEEFADGHPDLDQMPFGRKRP